MGGDKFMEDKELQKEILKFIDKRYKEPKHKKGEIVNDIHIEFRGRGYSQEIIDENLYSLAANSKISSGREIDDVNHKVYSPLFILEMGHEQLKPWWRKNLIIIIMVVAAAAAVIAAIFGALSYFKKF